MEKELVKVGDRFVADKNNFFGSIIITINEVENPTSKDGYGFWKTEELMHGRKNQKARIWWLLENCTKVK